MAKHWLYIAAPSFTPSQIPFKIQTSEKRGQIFQWQLARKFTEKIFIETSIFNSESMRAIEADGDQSINWIWLPIKFQSCQLLNKKLIYHGYWLGDCVKMLLNDQIYWSFSAFFEHKKKSTTKEHVKKRY